MTGIYGIHNTITDTWYVGQSLDIKNRWYQHKQALRHNTHPNNHLQRSYLKYGEDAFEWYILEECDATKLNNREMFWINEKDSFYDGYNQTLGGDGTLGAISPNRKAIVLLDTGQLFDSILSAAQFIGVPRTKLKDCIKHKKRCRGYWELVPETYSDKWRIEKLNERKALIQEHRKIALEKRQSTRPKKEPYVNPNGYHKWSDEAKKANKGKNGKAVVQMTMDGVEIAEFASSVIAGETLGINHRKIRMVCNGERNKCGNFRWKWKEVKST